MKLFQRKSPLEKEWEQLQKQEEKFLADREALQQNFLEKKLSDVVPDALQHTLNEAFCRAFSLIFERGTPLIEKTYNRIELEKRFSVHQYSDSLGRTRKTLRAFPKQARQAGTQNLLLSGISGIGMGFFGIGLPDIPVFTGILLRTVYEIALGYGYDYHSEQEQYLILLLIQGAFSRGETVRALNAHINKQFQQTSSITPQEKTLQIRAAASTLSQELLYMKFLQGIPLVGTAGGIGNMLCINQVARYASLKYQRRFLKNL